MTAALESVFVSYAGPDRAWAEWVAWQLQDAGYEVVLDHWNWGAGDNFILKMNAALASGRILALFSEAYFDPNRFTTDEWTAVLAAKQKLIPLRIDASPAPPILLPLLAPSLVSLAMDEARKVLLEAVAGPRRPDGEPVFPGAGSPGRLRGIGGSGPRLPGSLPRVWNLPARNAAFTGRDGMLMDLRQALSSGPQVAVQALRGRGGVGKTQVAIEYGHRFAGEYELVWWIRSEEPALIVDQLAALAVKTGAAQANTPPSEALDALAEELRTRTRWLLVFDNAEDPASLAPYLPSGNGHVLITSRNPNWQERAVVLGVDGFARSESIELLQARVPGLAEDDADRLAQELEDLPLALVQAAALLTEGLTLPQYFRLLDQNISKVLDEGSPDSYPVSLAAQVRLSTQRVAATQPTALALLHACSLLSPEPFPLHSCVGRGPETLLALAELLNDPLAAPKSLRVLAQQGLARVQDGRVQLHRLTQAVVRDQLTEYERADAARTAEALLVAATPGSAVDSATWAAWPDIIPHLFAIVPSDFLTDEGRDAVCQACWYLMDRGQAPLVLPRLQSMHECWRRQLGPGHHDTLWVAQCLARACSEVGDATLARSLEEEILERRRQTLGPDHRDTLGVASNLAIRLAAMGEIEAARDLSEDTLTRQRQTLGEDHPDTLTTASNLANRLRELGKLEAGMQLGMHIFARRSETLGKDHPDTLTSASNLEVWLAEMGAIPAARRLGEETLDKQRVIFGADHPSTLTTASNLANRLGRLGEFEKAKEIAEETLLRQQHVLGVDHHSTLITAFTLGVALAQMGENGPARELLEDTWERQRRILGENHEETLRSASSLGVVLTALGEIEVATELGEETLARQREVLGGDHPETLSSGYNLVIRLARLGRLAEAQQLGEEILARRRRILGENHPDVRATADLCARLENGNMGD
ncbi:FxSxx-COOH system tetratricopeptide repeat protein [Streptomyces sp. NPDC050548]|uniref:FxSxx-COOH system tetratricopeptide repeat protein n=1 Tax=Streptomyces sp. NPDC050548 TaxID=3365629 RepID=UPI0037B82308